MDFRFRAIDNKPPVAAAAACSSDPPPQDDSTNAELVKQKIKEEIMIREIVNRRMLEAEIRRELILEQELAMLRATGLTTQGLAFHEPSATRLLDQRLNHIVDQSSRAPPVSGSRSSLNSLPVRPFPEPLKEEMKPLDVEKKKCFILTKPDPEIFEAKKRKAKAAPEVAEGDDHREPIQPPSSKNSATHKFICKTCNITTTSEITFKTHLEGKKHKYKEGRALQTGVVLNQRPSPAEKGIKAPKQPALQNKGGFKFWCEMCQQGSNSMVVMDTHYLGRKHMARRLKLGQGNLEDQIEPQGNDEATDLIA